MRAGFIVAVSFGLVLSSCGESDRASNTDEDPLMNQLLENTAASAPTPELPNYTEREGDTYLYTSAVSEEDQKKGRAVGIVVIYRYRGNKDGVHVIETLDDAGNLLLTSECAEPCRIIRNRVGETIERIPFNPESMIGSAFEDAIAGRLEVAKRGDKVPSSTQPIRNETIDLNGDVTHDPLGDGQ